MQPLAGSLERIDQLKLSISDNGPRMSAQTIRKFEENTTVSSFKQGLGLYLINDLAQTMGCKIKG